MLVHRIWECIKHTQTCDDIANQCMYSTKFILLTDKTEIIFYVGNFKLGIGSFSSSSFDFRIKNGTNKNAMRLKFEDIIVYFPKSQP